MEESSEESGDEKKWDSKCYVCETGNGKLICCDDCSRVSHLVCADLSKVPSGNWFCLYCNEKKVRQRSTRNNTSNIGPQFGKIFQQSNSRSMRANLRSHK